MRPTEVALIHPELCSAGPGVSQHHLRSPTQIVLGPPMVAADFGNGRRIQFMVFEQPVHHITLSVVDLARSVGWYRDVFDVKLLAERAGDNFTRTLIALPNGLVLGLTQHRGTLTGDRFDRRRVGLDHLSIAVPTAADVQVWADQLEQRGIAHDPLVRAPSGTLVVCYDPDGIPVEVYSPGQ